MKLYTLRYQTKTGRNMTKDVEGADVHSVMPEARRIASRPGNGDVSIWTYNGMKQIWSVPAVKKGA